VRLAQKNKTRVRSQMKRGFPEAVKFEVHQKNPLDPCPFLGL
jgi:hypothetical protein